jgi:hypothetical protein
MKKKNQSKIRLDKITVQNLKKLDSKALKAIRAGDGGGTLVTITPVYC